MTNSIKNIHIWNHHLNPAEAEVAICVTPEHVSSMTQVRGRLVGPQCRYASTVEVAYALSEVSREYESTGIPGIRCTLGERQAVRGGSDHSLLARTLAWAVRLAH